MQTPYVVNVSSVQDFMACRYRWYCKWVLNRVPRYEGPALDIGKLIHTTFERHALEDISLQESAKQARDGFQYVNDADPDYHQREIGQKVLDTFDGLDEAWLLWQDSYSFDVPVLEVEQPFEITFPNCPGVIFRGRPDRVALMDSCVWHVQNRGLAATMNFGTYVRLARRHYHEHLYAEHLARKYADLGAYGGTFFNLVRKLKFRTYAGKKNEKTKTATEMFWQHPMSINLESQQHTDVMESLFYHVHEMRRVEDEARGGMYKGLLVKPRFPAPNEKMNGGFNGSTEDVFFKLLIGEIKSTDDRYFKDREDTYEIDASRTLGEES